MSEVAASLQWLMSQLAGIAPGGVHTGVAPPGTPTPYLTVLPYGGSDRMNMSGVRLWATDNWLVEAWGPDTDYAAIESAAKALDGALQKKSGAVSGGTILQCIRLNDRFATLLVGAQQWLRQGGVYEILTQAT